VPNGHQVENEELSEFWAPWVAWLCGCLAAAQVTEPDGWPLHPRCEDLRARKPATRLGYALHRVQLAAATSTGAIEVGSARRPITAETTLTSSTRRLPAR
jgi:hypothetical protein